MKMFKNLLFAILGVLFLLPIFCFCKFSYIITTLETYHFLQTEIIWKLF